MLNGLFILALGGWIWWYSGRFPYLDEGHPGPSLFPRVIGIGLLLSGLALLALSWLSRKQLNREAGYEPFSARGLSRMAAGIGLVGLYPLVQAQLGFMAALSMVCFLAALLLKARVWVAALTALGTVLFVRLIFINLLGLSL